MATDNNNPPDAETCRIRPCSAPKRNAHLHAPARVVDAVIFDMDGVVTRTAAAHAIAWKRMFDEYLRARARALGDAFREFEHPRDYLAHVDGRPRYEGVASFLRSRDIVLPFGSAADAPGFGTICALGNRKNALFNQIIETDGAELYASTIELIQNLLARGVRIGLATSSRNSRLILEKTGAADLFEVVVDGNVSEKRRLKGKPEPDIFLAACDRLSVDPARAAIVEDAVSGVQAGARGGFALTIGLARENNVRELRDNGADVVFADLSETSVDEIESLAAARAAHV